jgi:hypothetical protein
MATLLFELFSKTIQATLQYQANEKAFRYRSNLEFTDMSKEAHFEKCDTCKTAFTQIRTSAEKKFIDKDDEMGAAARKLVKVMGNFGRK